MTIEKLNTCDEITDVLDIIEDDTMTVIDFYADWCGPCKKIAPELEKISSEFPKVRFYKVKSLPTFVFIKGKKEYGRIEGANAAEIRRVLSSI